MREFECFQALEEKHLDNSITCAKKRKLGAFLMNSSMRFVHTLPFQLPKALIIPSDCLGNIQALFSASAFLNLVDTPLSRCVKALDRQPID